MKTILLIEDNLHKRDRTYSFLQEVAPQAELTFASSFTSASRALQDRQFDLIILDMSLPTFDKSPTESGGRFRTFGGREIARKLVRRKIATPIIFLTQYPNFSDNQESHTLESLGRELERECGNNYCGLVHYDSSTLDWKNELTRLISPIL